MTVFDLPEGEDEENVKSDYAHQHNIDVFRTEPQCVSSIRYWRLRTGIGLAGYDGFS